MATAPQQKPVSLTQDIQTGLASMFKNFGRQFNPLASSQLGNNLTTKSAGRSPQVLGASTGPGNQAANDQMSAIMQYQNQMQPFAMGQPTPQQSSPFGNIFGNAFSAFGNGANAVGNYFTPQTFLDPQQGQVQVPSDFSQLAQNLVGGIGRGIDMNSLKLLGFLGSLGLFGGLNTPAVKGAKTASKKSTKK